MTFYEPLHRLIFAAVPDWTIDIRLLGAYTLSAAGALGWWRWERKRG